MFASDTSSFFILVLAVVGISGEWRHRTITSSLLAAPDRRRFLAAKAVAFATAGLVLSLLIAVAVIVAGAAVLSFRGLPLPDLGELLGQFGRNACWRRCWARSASQSVRSCATRSSPWSRCSSSCSSSNRVVVALAPGGRSFRPARGPVRRRRRPPRRGHRDSATSSLLGTAPAVLLLSAWIGVAFVAGATLLRRRDLE